MIEAGFSGPCPGCEGTIHEGESVGCVAGEACCEECVESCGEDDYDGTASDDRSGDVHSIP